MKKILTIIIAFITATSITSCEKDYGPLNSDNQPDIPVTYPGAITHGFNPYLEHSLAGDGDNLSVTLEIPENSGRTIREITGVVAGPTGINAGDLDDEDEAYIEAPISGDGNQVVFTTTITEFTEKTGIDPAEELEDDEDLEYEEIAFMFRITLDNDQTIIPVQLRVRVAR